MDCDKTAGSSRAACPVSVSGSSGLENCSGSSFLLFKLLHMGDFQFSVQKCDALGGLEGIQEGGGGLLLLLGGGWWVWLVAWWVGGSF